MKCVVVLLLPFFFLTHFGIICYGYNSNRILNGIPAPSNKYQNVIKIFPLFINFKQPAEEAFVFKGLCTSTLISKRHLLTAAHCVTDHTRFQQSNSKATTVGIFIDYRPEQQMIDDDYFNLKNLGFATKVTYLPKWNANHWQFDMAIIELPAEITDIEPVLLAKNYKEIDNDTAIAVGYGDIDPDYSIQNYSKVLMEVTVPFASKNECSQREWYNVICAGISTHRADLGDSGGPLFVYASDGRLFEIGTVASTARKPPFWPPTLKPDFMTYMRISDYCDWIEETTKGEAKCIEMNENFDGTTTADIPVEKHVEELHGGSESISKNILVFLFILLFICIFNTV